jgi:MYXO-CTERM domain-containing protein
MKRIDPRPSFETSSLAARTPRPRSAASTRTALGLLAALALSGCAGANDGDAWSEGESADVASTSQLEQPIVGAETDTSHTAVLAVASQLRRSQALCTGTLIAPNLVLTAQHCVASTDDLVNCETSEFGTTYSPQNIAVSANTALNRAAQFYPVREVQVPPGGNDVCGSDIALIILDGRFNTITPMAPRLDSTVIAGEVYTAVGFGDALDEGDPGIRRARGGLEVACGPEQCRLPSALTSTEFIGDSSVCEGDSGGPALDSDGEILGVVSRGEEDCGATIYSAVAPWRDWILSVTERAIQLGNYPAPSWYTAARNSSNGSSNDDDGVANNGNDLPVVPGDVSPSTPGGDDDTGDLPSVSGDSPVRASKEGGCSTSGAGTPSAPWSALATLAAAVVFWRRRIVR